MRGDFVDSGLPSSLFRVPETSQWKCNPNTGMNEFLAMDVSANKDMLKFCFSFL